VLIKLEQMQARWLEGEQQQDAADVVDRGPIAEDGAGQPQAAAGLSREQQQLRQQGLAGHQHQQQQLQHQPQQQLPSPPLQQQLQQQPGQGEQQREAQLLQQQQEGCKTCPDQQQQQEEAQQQQLQQAEAQQTQHPAGPGVVDAHGTEPVVLSKCEQLLGSLLVAAQEIGQARGMGQLLGTAKITLRQKIVAGDDPKEVRGQKHQCHGQQPW
jgi:hypothetical protein